MPPTALSNLCDADVKSQRLNCKVSCAVFKGAENIFVARADNGNHFLDFGIQKGMMLIFDADKDFVDGHPSCFENSKTQKIKLLRHKEPGFKHSGKLIAAISYYED